MRNSQRDAYADGTEHMGIARLITRRGWGRGVQAVPVAESLMAIGPHEIFILIKTMGAF